jgi:hypothetical protein
MILIKPAYHRAGKHNKHQQPNARRVMPFQAAIDRKEHRFIMPRSPVIPGSPLGEGLEPGLQLVEGDIGTGDGVFDLTVFEKQQTRD